MIITTTNKLLKKLDIFIYKKDELYIEHPALYISNFFEEFTKQVYPIRYKIIKSKKGKLTKSIEEKLIVHLRKLANLGYIEWLEMDQGVLIKKMKITENGYKRLQHCEDTMIKNWQKILYGAIGTIFGAIAGGIASLIGLI